MPWSDVEILDSPQYEALTSITRCLHLREAMASFGKHKLTSHKIETRNVRVKAKVLWFAPTQPMNQHNMYGNMSFTLDWSRAVDQLGPYLYYIDQKGNGDIIYSRVLLTSKIHSNLRLVTENESKMPLLKRGDLHHVATASDGIRHFLEIGIEAGAARGKWLYANCSIQANDHSSANSRRYSGGPYKPCICHRFNYFNKVCPSPYPARQTMTILHVKCPMLRDAPSWNLTQFFSEMNTALELIVKGNDDDEDDETVYEDDEYFPNYDDHDNVTRQVSMRQPVTIFSNLYDDGEGSSLGASGWGISYTGGASSTETFRGSGIYGSSQTSSYGNQRTSGFQQVSTVKKEDGGLSTGSKVALAAGGLLLLSGLATAVAAACNEDDVKISKKRSAGENEKK